MDTLYRVTGPEGKLLHTCTDILGALALASMRVMDESPINVRGGGVTMYIVRDTVFTIAEPLPVGSCFRRQPLTTLTWRAGAYLDGALEASRKKATAHALERLNECKKVRVAKKRKQPKGRKKARVAKKRKR